VPADDSRPTTTGCATLPAGRRLNCRRLATCVMPCAGMPGCTCGHHVMRRCCRARPGILVLAELTCTALDHYNTDFGLRR
jgi:hypothetical protein